jgi:hypothetical protein
MPTPGASIPIQRVPSGLPGPGGTGFSSFAHADSGGYHHGSRCMFTTCHIPEGVGYSDCPLAIPNVCTRSRPS